MVRAFIMLNVDLGCERKVLDEVKKVDGVVEAHLVNGVYDIIGLLLKLTVFSSSSTTCPTISSVLKYIPSHTICFKLSSINSFENDLII